MEIFDDEGSDVLFDKAGITHLYDFLRASEDFAEDLIVGEVCGDFGDELMAGYCVGVDFSFHVSSNKNPRLLPGVNKNKRLMSERFRYI